MLELDSINVGAIVFLEIRAQELALGLELLKIECFLQQFIPL